MARRAHPLSIVDRRRFENYQGFDIEAANDRVAFLTLSKSNVLAYDFK